MKKLIIIETSDIGARYTADAAKRLGLDPVFLVNSNNYQGDTLSQLRATEHYEVDTTSVTAMAHFLMKQEWTVAAITTFLDSRLHLAIELSEMLQVRGLDTRFKAYKDKGAVYDLAPHLSPPSVCFHRAQFPSARIAELRAQFPRIIVKPRCTAGGIGARMFTANESLAALEEHVNTRSVPSHLQPEEWMVQAYVDGELVSVEGFVHEGETTLLGFTGRRKIGNTESWCGFPYERRLACAAADEARAKVLELLSLARIRFGFFHIELMISGGEAFIIDANMGRLGGGGIGEMFAVAFQAPPAEIFAEVLNLSLFPEAAVADLWRRAPRHAVSVAYGLPLESDLQEVRPVPPSVFHTQILDRGAHVPAMGTDNWAWVGIVSGEHVPVREFLRSVNFETSRGLQPAAFAMAGE
jgi:hypothetical protein